MTNHAHDTLLLALIAAAMGIVMEIFNPITHLLLRRHAEEVVRSKQLAVAPEILSYFAAGALSVAPLVPTFFGALIGAFTILLETKPSPFYLFVTVLVLIVLALLFARDLGKRNYYQTATELMRSSRWTHIKITYASFHSISICLINLLVAAAAAWFLWGAR